MMISSASGASFHRYAQRPSGSFTVPGWPVSGSGSKAMPRLSQPGQVMRTQVFEPAVTVTVVAVLPNFTHSEI